MTQTATHNLKVSELTTFLVTVSQAKTHLSMLLQRVQEGDDVVIVSRGKAVARLVPLATDAASELREESSPRIRVPYFPRP